MKAIIEKYSCVERIKKKMFLLNLAYKLMYFYCVAQELKYCQ